MTPFKLTVFTEPIAPVGFVEKVKSYLRPVKFSLQGKRIPAKKKYGGHYSVTRSLLEGLQKIETDHNYNPSGEKDIAENVVVLAGVERLKEIITLKKKGKIRTLVAGPNIVDDVLSEAQLVADPSIDLYIVPSEWVKRQVTEDCAALKNRVLCWSAGINSQFWKPEVKKEKRDKVLIYWKTEPEEFCNDVEWIVKESGRQTAVIRYGNYSINEYKAILDQTRFAVFISRSESQGIAMFEAWAMDVPTFVFDPGQFNFYGRTISYVSASPYLSDVAGNKWKNLEELKNLVNDENILQRFSPRKYVLDQFTDEHCAEQLVKSIQSLK